MQMLRADVEHAFELLSEKRFNETLAVCDLALADSPTDFDGDPRDPKLERSRGLRSYSTLRTLRSEALFGLHRYDEALVAYDWAVRLDPWAEHAFLGRGNTLLQLHRYDEALAAYDRAVDLDPEFAAAHFNRGLTLRILQRNEEALEAHDRAVQLTPLDGAAHRERGGALQRLRRSADALAAYDRAIQLDPLDAAAHLGRGRALSRLKLRRLPWRRGRNRERNEEALEAYDRAVQLDPFGESAHVERGLCLFRLGRRDEALVAFDRAVQLAPLHEEADFMRVHLLEEALAAFDREVPLDPLNEVPRGLILLRLRRNAEALAAFDRAVRLNPSDAAAHTGRGIILGRLERQGEALAAFDQAVQLDPMADEAHFYRGLVLSGEPERSDEALAALDLAVEIDPSKGAAHSARGSLLLELESENEDEALEAFDRAIRLNPADAPAHTGRGITLKRLKRYPEALVAFDQALQLDASLKAARQERAPLLLHLEFIDGALQDFEALDDPLGKAECWLQAMPIRFASWNQTPASALDLNFGYFSAGAQAYRECVDGLLNGYNDARARLRFLIDRQRLQQSWTDRFLELSVHLARWHHRRLPSASSGAVTNGLDYLAWDAVQVVKSRTFLEDDAARDLWRTLLQRSDELRAAQEALELAEVTLDEARTEMRKAPSPDAAAHEAEAVARRGEARALRYTLLDVAADANPDIAAAASAAPAAMNEVRSCLRDDELYVDLLRTSSTTLRLCVTRHSGLSVEVVEDAEFQKLRARRDSAILGEIPEGTRTLLISPHGDLVRVPFHELTVTGKGDPKLGERYAVAVVPAARLLVRARGATPPAVDIPYLGVACNADGNIGQVDREVEHVHDRYFPKGDHYSTQKSTALLTERRRTRVLHLACHAGPHGLQLQVGSKAWTTPSQLLDLGLRADLLVCTGCSTGRFDDDAANEFLGIVRQLLTITGARAAVVSLEPVRWQGLALADLLFAALTGTAPAIACGLAPGRPLSVGEALLWARPHLRRMAPSATDTLNGGLPVGSDAARGPADVNVEHVHSDPWILIGDPSVMGR